jgi:hypothetical protein
VSKLPRTMPSNLPADYPEPAMKLMQQGGGLDAFE